MVELENNKVKLSSGSVFFNHHLPQVFIKGKYVGGVGIIKSMFEVEELAKILDGFTRRQLELVFEGCGDVRFVNYNGSRKVFDENIINNYLLLILLINNEKDKLIK